MSRCIAVALLLALPALAHAANKELVGKYQMDVQGGDVLELRADGSASMAGEETRWSAAGGQLTVGTDVMPYQLANGRLVLTMGTVQMAWKKLGAAGKGPSPMQKAAAKAKGAQPEVSDAEADREAMEDARAYLGQGGNPQAPTPTAPQPAPAGHAKAPRADPGADAATPSAGGNPQDAQARQLLTSSAWCSFTYNKVSGTSTTAKVIFRPDGVVTLNGGAETYNSGPNGSYAGQSANGGAGRWKLENLRLYIDQGQGAGFQDVGLTAERNSSGYPILHAAGKEYSMCN